MVSMVPGARRLSNKLVADGLVGGTHVFAPVPKRTVDCRLIQVPESVAAKALDVPGKQKTDKPEKKTQTHSTQQNNHKQTHKHTNQRELVVASAFARVEGCKR